MNESAKPEQELSDNYSRKPVTRNCTAEKLNPKPPLTHTLQNNDVIFKKPVSPASATLSSPRSETSTSVKEINHPTNCNEIIASSNTLSQSQSSSIEKDHKLLTEENDNSGSSSSKRQRWDLASFVFPDNNLPQSWLDIMETNKKMKPFDNLQTKILPKTINPKTSAPVVKTDTFPLDKPCTSKSVAPFPPRVMENAHSESTPTTTTPTPTTTTPTTTPTPTTTTTPTPTTTTTPNPTPTTTPTTTTTTEENMDHELSLMPELTLSIPERNSEDFDFTPSDFEKEIPSFAPKIEPYDPKIKEQFPRPANQVIKVISSGRGKGKEGKASTGKSKVSTGKKPETEIQLRIIETRRTRKLMEFLKPPPPQKVQTIPANCKSMKKKSNSVLQQQQQQANINKRIRTQISIMQKEAKKKSPDLEFLRRKMCLDETFNYRIAKFMQDEHSIEDLLKEFPALKIKSIVMDEFERVVEITNPMVRCNPINFLENALKKRFQRNVSKIRTLPHQIPLITSALRKLDKDPKNECLKQIVCAVSMIMTFSVDKSISSVIALKKEKEAFCYRNIGLPKLVLKEKFILEEKTTIQVYLEGQEIFQVANIYEGLIAIFAISHVFNLDYEKLVEPLMRYFEFLVDIPQVLYQEEDPLPSDDEL